MHCPVSQAKADQPHCTRPAYCPLSREPKPTCRSTRSLSPSQRSPFPGSALPPLPRIKYLTMNSNLILISPAAITAGSSTSKANVSTFPACAPPSPTRPTETRSPIPPPSNKASSGYILLLISLLTLSPIRSHTSTLPTSPQPAGKSRPTPLFSTPPKTF